MWSYWWFNIDCLKQPILVSFVLNKPSGYEVFCDSEKIHYKKMNKSVLTTKIFCLESDENEEVGFNQETLTFSLKTIKIWSIN